jgi:hypothetical protein
MSQPPFPPSEPEPPPTLSPEVVADDEALAESVDAAIHRNVEARARLHEIADLQEYLRQGVDADVWKLVLNIDEMIVERWADVAVNVARWAFLEGQRHLAPPSEATPAESGDPRRGAS